MSMKKTLTPDMTDMTETTVSISRTFQVKQDEPVNIALSSKRLVKIKEEASVREDMFFDLEDDLKAFMEEYLNGK